MANRRLKKLETILKKHSGRDRTGQVSVRHQGARQKRYYRAVNFNRMARSDEATVTSIDYDPNRTADIALIEYKSGQKEYIIAPSGLKIGKKIVANDKAELEPGNVLTLNAISVGIEIHNIEIYPGSGGQLVKIAGNSATIIAKDGQYAHIQLPSRELRRFLLNCRATIGKVSNIDHKLEVIGKAGRKRLMGIRPTVRGVAQNPRSHPHGGGEGKSGTGMHPKTKWGKPAYGKRTRTNKRTNKFILQRRKK